MIMRIADRRYPDASVSLAEVNHTLGIYFRALGGDGGLQIEAADARANPAHRSWIQKLAGANTRIHLAWCDERALRLLPGIACFDDSELNKDMYFWLAALGTCADHHTGKNNNWFNNSQQLIKHVLERFPGLLPRYWRLVKQHLLQRPTIDSLVADEADNDYLPYIFGKGDYVVIHDPRRLPRELPQLYALLNQ
jgi:nitric oxide reductase NorD protein